MRILIVSQYFWPEYFRINELAAKLARTPGNTVDVLTGYPNYPSGVVDNDFISNKKKYQQFNGVNIHRVPIFPRKNSSNFNLSVNYTSFLLSGIFLGFFKIRKKKYDVIFTFATSPILVALISIFFSKIYKIKHVLWVQDLWPNVLYDLGILKNSSLTYRFMNKIVNFIYSNSDKILCQSNSYKKEIGMRNSEFKKKCFFYPSWSETKFLKKFKKTRNLFNKDFLNILFAGNIGESQNFDLVLELIRRNRNKKIIWHIIGAGRYGLEVERFKKKQNLKNLILYKRMKFEEIQEYFHETDVLLISLKKGKAFDYTIPGKFQTYLSYNKFIFGLIGGEVKKMIMKYNLGLASESQNIDKLTKLLDIMIDKKINNTLSVDTTNKRIKNLKKLFSFEYAVLKMKKHLLFCLDYSVYELITNVEKIKNKKRYILSALNLAFLGFFIEKKIPNNRNIVLWPDGLTGVKFAQKKLFNKEIKKIPGSEIIEKIIINKNQIKKILVLGVLEKVSKTYLTKKFSLPIEHIDLPYGNIEKIKEYIPLFKIQNNILCLITLPTPKQEIIADYIFNILPKVDVKIICIGGGLAIASGSEKKTPTFLNSFFFGEALWRLRVETKRRTVRLLRSGYYFLQGILNSEFKKIKIYIKK